MKRSRELASLFPPTAKTLVQAGLDQTVHLWDLATGKELAAFNGQSGAALTAVAYSPDGKVRGLREVGIPPRLFGMCLKLLVP